MSGGAEDAAAGSAALSFDAIAADYDRARPDYPPALFDDLFATVGRFASVRVLEVGCGTGIATQGLVRPGVGVVAIDPGGEMLAQARRRLGSAAVRFVESSFEAFAPDAGEGFDLIASAQAWHWVDPVIGYPKAARLLAPGGVLALFGNVQADPPPPLAAAFARAFGDRPWSLARAGYGVGGFIARDLAATGLFAGLRHLSYARPFRWIGDAYAAMVATHSTVQALGPDVRARLLADLLAAIERLGGELETQMETHAWLGLSS